MMTLLLTVAIVAVSVGLLAFYVKTRDSKGGHCSGHNIEKKQNKE